MLSIRIGYGSADWYPDPASIPVNNLEVEESFFKKLFIYTVSGRVHRDGRLHDAAAAAAGVPLPAGRVADGRADRIFTRIHRGHQDESAGRVPGRRPDAGGHHDVRLRAAHFDPRSSSFKNIWEQSPQEPPLGCEQNAACTLPKVTFSLHKMTNSENH